MFNLIIVDDEDIILNGLSKYLNWEALNFHLVGTSHSMSEALELIENIHVDVVLTDIRMEFESGLDLIETLAKDYPLIKTVILSGYEDFEYARRALQYGTFDFLTKPVNFDILHTTFERLNNTLSSELIRYQGYGDFIALRKSTFLNNLAKESIPIDSSLAKQLDIQLTSTTLQVARIHFDFLSIDETHQTQQLLQKAISEIIPSHPNNLYFCNTPDEMTLIFYDTPKDVLISQLESLIQLLPFNVTIGLSNTFPHLQTLHTAYFQAGKALDYKLIKRNSTIISFDEIQNILYIENVISDELHEKILHSLLLKDIQTLIQLVMDAIHHIGNHRDTLNLVYSFCIEFYLTIHRFLKTHLADPIHDDLHDLIKQLIFRETIEDIIDYTLGYIEKQAPYILQISSCSEDSIKTAKNYIQEHFSESLTLNTLAEFLFIHPIYLSKLFKEKTGENFIDYLTRIRLEKAKQLLVETHFKIYDISEMVGYESPKYFSKLFKDVVGTTPKLYRSSHVPDN